RQRPETQAGRLDRFRWDLRQGPGIRGCNQGSRPHRSGDVGMKLALDTNRYTDFWNAVPEVVRRIEDVEEIYLPFIVLGELRCGFLWGRRRAENERALQAFLRKPPVRILWPD